MATAECRRETERHPSGLYPALFAMFTEHFAFYVTITQILFVMTERLGLSETRAISIYSAYAVGIYLVAIPAGLLSDLWLGPRRSVLIGLGAVAIGLGQLSLLSLPGLYGGLIAMAVGSALVKTSLIPLVAGLYPTGSRRMGGGLLALYCAVDVGALLAPIGSDLIRVKLELAAVFILTGALELGALVVLLLGQRRLVRVASPQPQTRKQIVRGVLWFLLAAAAIAVCKLLVQTLEQALTSQDVLGIGNQIFQLRGKLLVGVFGALAIFPVALGYWLLRRVQPMQSILARLLAGAVVMAVMMGAVQLADARPDGWPRVFAFAWAMLAGGSVSCLLTPTVYEVAARVVPRFAATATAIYWVLSAGAMGLAARLGAPMFF